MDIRRRLGAGRKLALITLSACLLCVRPVAATPVTYTFNGSVTFLNVLSSDPTTANIDAWLPGFAEGMPLFGTLVVDPSTQSSAMQVTVGSYVFASDGFSPTVVNDSSFVINDTPGYGDAVTLWDAFPSLLTATPTPFLADDLYLNLWDLTGTALSSTDFPSCDLSIFANRLITFDGLGFAPRSSAIVDWKGTIDSMQEVPEPSTVLLLLTGFASLGGARWKRRRRA